MPEIEKLSYSYDEEADVLYITLGESEPCHSEDDGTGVLLRTSLADSKPNGVTVMYFKQTYGELGADALCFNIQHFLKIVPLEFIENKIMGELLGYKLSRQTSNYKGIDHEEFHLHPCYPVFCY